MSGSATDHQAAAATELQGRSGAYRLFARLFREAPTPELLGAIAEHRLLPDADPQWPHQAEALAVEYARLFAVPGGQSVQPYESAYCDTLTIDASTACSPYLEPEPQPGGVTGFLYGPSAVAVREAYRQAGFELDAGAHELPDHLAIELEFMGRLLERGDLQLARTFFIAHLNRWVCRALDDIGQQAASGFYRAVADALADFLQHEREALLAVT